MKTIKKEYSSDIHNVHGSMRHCWQCAWTANDKTTEQPDQCNLHCVSEKKFPPLNCL